MTKQFKSTRQSTIDLILTTSKRGVPLAYLIHIFQRR